jgi:hypothetical protein
METPRIEYRPTLWDRMVFTLVHQFRTPVINGMFILFALLIFNGGRHKYSVAVNLITAVLMYVMMWLVQVVFLATYFFSRRRDAVATEHVMEIQRDALFNATKYSETRIFWPSVRNVILRPGCVVIFIAHGTACWVPNRAFTSRAGFRVS